MKKRVAVSIGDLNGIGVEIALKAHKEISKYIKPIYIIDKKMLKRASKALNIEIPKDFKILSVDRDKTFKIKAGKISKKSGEYSFLSFKKGVKLAKKGEVDAILTLPIHKEAWRKANIDYVGHTDFLRDYFKKDAIMMLGSEKLYVGLFTEHIPLKDVAKSIKTERLTKFLLDFQKSLNIDEQIGVLGLNPHAGDGGVLGNEEIKIDRAIKKANKRLKKDIFVGSLVPDIAFTKSMREKFRYFIALYHDQGLAPLKALYFDEAINVSLNLPILRVSVDHGTAFDIAYKKGRDLNLKSYINAVKFIESKKRK